MKKSISFVLAGIMTFAACVGLGGCGGKKSKADTIYWYVGDQAFDYKLDVSSEFGKLVKEKFGLEIEFVVPNSTTGYTPLTTKIMKGDMYDILTLPKSSTLFDDAIKSDLLYTYEELFDKYQVENFIPESMKRRYSREEGLYGILSHFADEENTDAPIYANQILIAQKNLMDEYGIVSDDFSSMEKFKQTLAKAKRNTEISNFIPFFDQAGGQSLMQWLAIPKEDENGDWQDRRRTPEAEQLFVDLNDMYKKGLITTESFTGGLTERQAILQGNVFCMVANWAEMQSYLTYSYEQGKEWVLVGPLRNDKGDDPVMDPWTRNGYLATSVSRKSDKAEKILRLLKFLYSDEGQIAATYGFEGETYIKDENGKIVYTPEYRAMTSEEVIDKYGIGWIGVLLHRSDYLSSIEGEEVTAARRAVKNMLLTYTQYTYDSRALEDCNPRSGALKTNDLQAGTYYEQQYPKIITDKTLSAEQVKQAIRNAVSFIDEKYNYGPIGKEGSVLDYMNRKFKANKESLGVEYVWPAYKNRKG